MPTAIFANNRLPKLDCELAGRLRRALTLANRALDDGAGVKASRWLFRVMRDPATPGLTDAMARYRHLTRQAALH